MKFVLASLALTLLCGCAARQTVTFEKGCCNFTTTVTAPINPPSIKDFVK